MEIIRGTTPPITIKFNFDASTITVLFLTIAQQDETIIEKELDAGVVGADNIVFTLSQAETLSLAPETALLQIRYRIGDGAFATKLVDLNVSDVLKDGEI